MPSKLALVLHEDDHLLVVNKPAGWNTHAPSPYAGEGVYEWLKHRRPEWGRLAIIHRLDKETSGVLVFSKTEQANRALTQQFTEHKVRKTYVLLTDRPVPDKPWTVRSVMERVGEKYRSVTGRSSGAVAETTFQPRGKAGDSWMVEALPKTGKTHQIRVHAAESGFPILGDVLYGGREYARVCLHARSITLWHPQSGGEVRYEVPVRLEDDPRRSLREAILDPTQTDCYRLLHGAGDGRPGLYVDRLGGYILAQVPAGRPLDVQGLGWAGNLPRMNGVYVKQLQARVRQLAPEAMCPRLVSGVEAPETFGIRENDVEYEVSFREGYSVGLFLDQRENRRRILENHIASGWPWSQRPPQELTVLNTFAYTCGFSVAAAKLGARTVSVDLSKKYLEWGQRNFARNAIPLEGHEFLYGDVFSWLKRFARRERLFDCVLLDPPTFSTSKEGGRFQAEADYRRLAVAALGVLGRSGVLFASTNAAELAPEKFLNDLREAARECGRRILQEHYVPQPPDFPICRAEPAYLKTAWFWIE